MSELITIEINALEVQNMFARLIAKAQDLTPVMNEIAGEMLYAVERNFDEEGRPKWPKLKPSTLAQRAKEGKEGGKILQRSGRLAASITKYSDGNQAIVGTNVVYAAIHQMGGEIPAREITPKNKEALFWPGALHPVKKVKFPGAKIPARPFLQLTDGDMDNIKDILRRYIANIPK